VAGAEAGQVRALIAVCALTACSSPEVGEVHLAPLDRATFDARVEPILERRCASTSCHGVPARGLPLYAPLQYRADPAHTWVIEPLTEAELRNNFTAATIWARQTSGGGMSMLLAKPLAEHAAEFHGGGATFASVEDGDFATLAEWVSPPP